MTSADNKLICCKGTWEQSLSGSPRLHLGVSYPVHGHLFLNSPPNTYIFSTKPQLYFILTWPKIPLYPWPVKRLASMWRTPGDGAPSKRTAWAWGFPAMQEYCKVNPWLTHFTQAFTFYNHFYIPNFEYYFTLNKLLN